MKNLLEHFRLKRSKAAEAPEAAPEPTKAIEKSALPAFTPPAGPRALKPAWHTASAPAVQSKRPPALPERSAPAEMLTLTLNDFLDRIPAEFLDKQEHDRSIPMPFELGSLSERMGRGETMIPVQELSRRIPDIFRPDAVIPPDRTMPFPWKKVLDLVVQTRAGSTVPGLSRTGVETLSHKLKARKVRRPSKMAPAPGRNAPAAAESSQPLQLEAAPASAAPPSAKPALPAPVLLPPPESTDKAAAPIAPIAPIAPAVPHAEQAPANSAAPSSSVDALELVRLKTDYDRQLATLTRERDQSAAEIQTLRRDLTTHQQQSSAACRAAADLSAKLLLLQKQHAALDAERNDALTRAAEFGLEHDAAIGRTGEISAERDAAAARTTELTTERDAAVAQAAKVAADNEAAVALATELTAERDAATARSTELAAERDAAVARTTELAAERDAAAARSAELAAERDAAVARTAELQLAREVPAADARTPDHLVALAAILGSETPAEDAGTPDQAAWQSRAVTQLTADIDGYRNTIKALLRERDALRSAQPPLTAVPTGTGLDVEAKSPHPATASATPADPYSTIFPEHQKNSRVAAVVVLALLALGILSQFRSASPSAAEPETPASPVPALTAAPLDVEKLTLETSAGAEAPPAPEPLLHTDTDPR